MNFCYSNEFFVLFIRSNPDEIMRYFAPMKKKIATLYDNLRKATSSGNIREVLKLEEKIKLLR